MNPIATLSDKDLLLKVKSLVKEEKRITQEVLNHLEEVEYRKLFLSEGYPTLFDYCVKELGYGQGSANRRISAMRLIKTIPEAKEKLKLGSVNLSTLSQLHGFLRREEKEKTYTKDMKLDLLGKIEGKSQDQCEREFIKISPIENFKEKKKTLTEEFTQVTFIASKELMAKLDLIKNLTAHRNSNPSMAEVIELMADMTLKEVNPVKLEKKGKEQSRSGESANAKEGQKSRITTQSETAAARRCVKNEPKINVQSNSSRYIPSSIRQSVWKRDQGQCQYINKETGKICESKFALQMDHIHPFSLGGNNKEENLRLLCRAHNNWRTKELGHLPF